MIKMIINNNIDLFLVIIIKNKKVKYIDLLLFIIKK